MRRILIIVVTGAVAVAACGGSSSNTKAKTNTPGASSGSSAFDELYNQRSNATLKVTYQNLDSSGKAGDSFTIAQQGKDKTSYTSGDSQTITLLGKRVGSYR